MPRYVVPDTSALSAALYREVFLPQATPLLQAVRTQAVSAVAPFSMFSEFFNVSRKKLIPTPAAPALGIDDVEAIVADFLTLPMFWVEMEAIAPAAWRLHIDHGIETGDAFFLEIARQWQAELWTIDEQFYRSASLVYPKVFDLRVIPFV